MLPLSAASCAAACGRGIAAAALRLTLSPAPLLGCRCYSYAGFFVSRYFVVSRAGAHPHFPPQFRGRRLQGLVYLVRKDTRIMIGRVFTFLAEAK